MIGLTLIIAGAAAATWALARYDRAAHFLGVVPPPPVVVRAPQPVMTAPATASDTSAATTDARIAGLAQGLAPADIVGQVVALGLPGRDDQRDLLRPDARAVPVHHPGGW